MKKTFLSILIIFILFFGTFIHSAAQSQPLQYTYPLYQKLNSTLYGTHTRQHTAIKPLGIDSLVEQGFDSLMNNLNRGKTSWAGQKLWNEHLIDIKGKTRTFFADYLPDAHIGQQTAGQTSLWRNGHGIQIGGTLADKLAFHGAFFYNSERFPDYLDRYIHERGVIPNEPGAVRLRGEAREWSYATANVSYTPNKYLNVAVGYDKNFIGDGYRSLLLSDVSPNYYGLRLTGTLGNVQYMSLWAYMRDPFATELAKADESGTIDLGNKRNRYKWGAFQYLDWNVSNRFSVGFFQSVLWAPQNESGQRGFDFNYINPFIFLRSVELTNTSSPDKMHLGLNSKYKLPARVTLYGQFLLGEFTAREFFAGDGYIHNKFGFQLGVRGYNLFDIKRLNFLTEFNTARPYTYQHFNPITAYTNDNQPLAHPLGANFREGLAILNYSYKRLDFHLQGNWAMYGLDPDEETNFGGNLFKDYNNYVHFHGNTIGQGVTTHLTYANFRTAYVINPKYNLRIETEATARREWNAEVTHRDVWFSIGLKSSFRNLYRDF